MSHDAELDRRAAVLETARLNLAAAHEAVERAHDARTWHKALAELAIAKRARGKAYGHWHSWKNKEYANARARARAEKDRSDKVRLPPGQLDTHSAG